MVSSADPLWFVDSNVLVYLIDASDARKNKAATQWLEVLWERDLGRISPQVVHEFYTNATRKLGAPVEAVRERVLGYSAGQLPGFSREFLQRAWFWEDEAQLNYWDALIVASAETLGCRWLLTEDLQHGRRFGVLEVVDPFRSDPASLFPE